MAENFYFLPKGTLIIKLPRRSPLMLRMIMLAAVMMCSMYISFTCLKQMSIPVKPASTRMKPIEKYSYDSRLVGLKQTKVPIKQELDEHSYDPRIVGLKQTEVQIKPELPSREPSEHSYDPRIVGLEQTEVQIKPELPMTKPSEHSYDPRIVGLEQPVTETKLELMRTKPIEEHSFDPRTAGLNQTGVQINSDMARKDPIEQHSYDPKVIGLKQTKIQIKPESVRIKPTEHSYVPQIDSLKERKIQIKPVLEGTMSTDQHSYDPKITGVTETKVQVKTEMLRINLTQPPCQDPGIPQSEIPYVHYPVPTNYSRGRCACTPVRFYIIVSMQRSGSKWLESLLNSHINVSSNGEIFIDRERSANVSTITKILDKVYNLDWRHGASKKFCTAAVGFKWMLNQGIIENHEEVSKYFKQRGVSAIFLFRRNLLRRMISLLANSQDHKQLNRTHKAHVRTQHEAEILASYKPKLSVKSLVSKLKHAATRAAEAKEHFKSIRNMDLYYEDLVQNTTQKLTEVMEFLGVPQRRLSSSHVKIHTRPMSQMVRNWNAVRRALKGSQFQSFLASD